MRVTKTLLAVAFMFLFANVVNAQQPKKDWTNTYLVKTDLSQKEIKEKLLNYLKTKGFPPEQMEKGDITEFHNAFSLLIPQSTYKTVGMTGIQFLTKFYYRETITIVDGGIVVKFDKYNNDTYKEWIGEPYYSANQSDFKTQKREANTHPGKWQTGGTYPGENLSLTKKRWDETVDIFLRKEVKKYAANIKGKLQNIKLNDTETWRLIDGELLPLQKNDFKAWCKKNNISKKKKKEYSKKIKEATK